MLKATAQLKQCECNGMAPYLQAALALALAPALALTLVIWYTAPVASLEEPETEEILTW